MKTEQIMLDGLPPKDESVKLRRKQCSTCMSKYLIDAGYRKADEVRKETAKEILNNLYCYPHEYHKERILELAKKYGIEVDE